MAQPGDVPASNRGKVTSAGGGLASGYGGGAGVGPEAVPTTTLRP